MRTLLEEVEVIINRLSPMENFEIKELCAREILKVIRERVKAVDWEKVSEDGHSILISKADVLKLLTPL